MFVIAGVTGKTGGVVARLLLEQGKQVRVLVRQQAAAGAWRDRGADVAVGTLDDREFLRRALSGAEGFYALLPEDLAADDVHGPRRRMAEAIAEAVADAHVPHVVFLSAMAAVLPDGNGPAADLHHAERLLRALPRTRVSVLRPVSFQENAAMAIGAARTQGVFPSLLPAQVPVPTIATRDVARRAAQALLEPPSQSAVTDLVGPAYTSQQMATELGRVLGKSLQVAEVPPAQHVHALVGAGVSPAFATAVAELYACLSAGRVKPAGDRMVQGSTTLPETLRELVGERR